MKKRLRKSVLGYFLVRSLQNLVLLAFIKRNYKPLIILAICGALAFLRPNADETTGLLNLGLRVRVPPAPKGAVAQLVEHERPIKTCRPSFWENKVVGINHDK